MRRSTLVSLALLSFLIAAPSHANVIPPMSLGTQHALAELVVVARLGERRACVIARQVHTCAEILADVVLKGPPEIPGTPRYLILSSNIAEAGVAHLDLSGTMLLFLRSGGEDTFSPPATRRQYYAPVQAFRSILPVDVRNNE